jgi:uncharacterized protein (DUF1501 family)
MVMQPLSRRECLGMVSAGLLGCSRPGWFGALARAASEDPRRKKACILLWMTGGPSQTDTFDMKPGHENGGPFKEIRTSAPDIRVCEHLPNIAKHMDKMAVIRSMATKEGEHVRANEQIHTGYPAGTPIRYPFLGSIVAKELGDDKTALPHFIYLGGGAGATGGGYLGPKYGALSLGVYGSPNDAEFLKSLHISNLKPQGDVTAEESNARIELLQQMQKDFEGRHRGEPLASTRAAYDRAIRLMQTSDSEVFDIQKEPEKVRDSYGGSRFGQLCLVARRLVEHGVPFVEVNSGNSMNGRAMWDSHLDNFNQHQLMCETIDTPWAALMDDLKAHGLLDSTLVIWMGEFGRTPQINKQNGRDHFPNGWTTVLGGGGIKGGQTVGKTSKDGMEVEERPVSRQDFLATVCQALEIDHTKQYTSNIGRPVRIVEAPAKPIKEILP